MSPPDRRDVSQLRLTTLSDYLAPALAAAGAGVWDYDAVSDRVVSRGSAAQLYGLPEAVRDAGVPLSLLAIGVHPDDRPAYLDRVAGLRTRGGLIDVQYRTISTDGRIRRVLVRGRCDLDLDGIVTHASGLVLDITGDILETTEVQRALAHWDEADQLLAGLSLAADYATAARRVIDKLDFRGLPALRRSSDAMLRTLGHEIAAISEGSPRTKPH